MSYGELLAASVDTALVLKTDPLNFRNLPIDVLLEYHDQAHRVLRDKKRAIDMAEAKANSSNKRPMLRRRK